MMTTYAITHHILTLLQFLVVAARSSSNQVLSFLLSPLILFPPPSLQQVQDSCPLVPHLPEALELCQCAVPPPSCLSHMSDFAPSPPTCWLGACVGHPCSSKTACCSRAS